MGYLSQHTTLAGSLSIAEAGSREDGTRRNVHRRCSMWSTVAIEMQAQSIAAERRAEVAAARLADAARRIAACAETERRMARNTPAAGPAAQSGPAVPAGL